MYSLETSLTTCAKNEKIIDCLITNEKQYTPRYKRGVESPKRRPSEFISESYRNDIQQLKILKQVQDDEKRNF
ncbi:hypothetical protein LH29_01515 [Draconibacterium sediminis]|uniref:Uncharacterized protein n=1 Tax=Draconibacterium sediminis TaxID=1544798 RepID=A0A0D8JEH3_9BACT|nr:hypothetical protein LH29_01515 [Draconibacterium sediminis]